MEINKVDFINSIASMATSTAKEKLEKFILDYNEIQKDDNILNKLEYKLTFMSHYSYSSRIKNHSKLYLDMEDYISKEKEQIQKINEPIFSKKDLKKMPIKFSSWSKAKDFYRTPCIILLETNELLLEYLIEFYPQLLIPFKRLKKEALTVDNIYDYFKMAFRGFDNNDYKLLCNYSAYKKEVDNYIKQYKIVMRRREDLMEYFNSIQSSISKGKIKVSHTEEKSYIYGIFSNQNLIYLGITQRPIQQRLNEHLACMKDKNISNSQQLYLYKFLRENETTINFKILWEGTVQTRKELEDKEKFLLEILKPKFNYDGVKTEYHYSKYSKN